VIAQFDRIHVRGEIEGIVQIDHVALVGAASGRSDLADVHG
jgi:hypothetical protein